MKCENCGSELVGGAIVCRQCSHNNAQGRVSQWRARRTGDLQPPTRTISPLADAAKPSNSGNLSNSGSLRQGAPESRPLQPRRSNSIPFEPKIQIHQAPASPASSPNASKNSSGSSSSGSLSPRPVATNDSETQEQPAWRTQLKDRVKQSRERKIAGSGAAMDEPDEAELDPNPIVEAALKRIRWASHAPAATSTMRVTRRGAQAAALAEESDFDVEPPAPIEMKSPALKIEPPAEAKAEVKIDQKPTSRVEFTPTNPLLARKPATQPINYPETKPLPPETKPLPPRPPAFPKPQIRTTAESRVEIPPPAKPETKPVVESKIAEPKPRVTGDLKAAVAPPPSAQPAVKPSTEKNAPISAPVQARKTVETKVIELTQPDAAPATKSKPPKPSTKDLPAKIWVRTLAGACDFEIIAMAYLPLFASYATLNTSLGRDSLAIMFVLLATLTFCYQLLTLTLADRTSGMAFLNLRLVNVAGAGKPIVFTQKFARAVAATAAFLCPPLNLIVMQSNQQRHSLPDLLSGTTLTEK